MRKKWDWRTAEAGHVLNKQWHAEVTVKRFFSPWWSPVLCVDMLKAEHKNHSPPLSVDFIVMISEG